MKIFFVFVTLFSRLTYGERNTRLNSWADSVIKSGITELKSTDQEFIPVPQFDVEIVEHLGKTAVRRGLLAVEGVFGGLATLSRAGDVDARQVGATTSLVRLPLVLHKAGVHFDTVVYQCGSVTSVGELEVTVPAYDMSVNVTFVISGSGDADSCSARVESVTLCEFRDVDVTVSDSCVGETAYIGKWAVQYFNQQVNYVISSTLQRLFTKQSSVNFVCPLV